MAQQYCLRWNNHRTNLLNVFDELLQNEAFTDVTLCVEGGHTVKCHKMVLAACSPFFQNIFIELPCKHPIVVLKDVKFHEIQALLEYMYRGEVNIAQEQLSALLKIAEVLKVKGLVDENGLKGSSDDTYNSRSPPPSIGTSATSGTPLTNGHVSPPHSTGSTYNGYGKSPVDRGQGHMSLPMWPLSGLSIPSQPTNGHQTPSHRGPGSHHGSYDNGFDSSPLKRKKFSHLLMHRDTPILRTVLGQGHADSSQGMSLLHSDHHEYRNGHTSDSDDKRGGAEILQEPPHSSYAEAIAAPRAEDEERQQPPTQSSADTDSKSGDDPQSAPQRPEWKRYKQYTRTDILSAIDAVRTGMSALQAARKFGVPSRTLYDKVKKLGITTSRPFKRGSTGTSSACFPYGIGGNANGAIYGGSASHAETESESENNQSMILEAVYRDDPQPSTSGLAQPCNASNSSVVAQQCRSTTSGIIAQSRPATSTNHQQTRATPSVSPHQQPAANQPSLDDEVEDLSVSRKSDVRVIVPSTSGSMDEDQDVGPGAVRS